MGRIPVGTRVRVVRPADDEDVGAAFANKVVTILEDDGSTDDDEGIPYLVSSPSPGFDDYYVSSAEVEVVQDENVGPYSRLERVYALAVEQASKGKGAERHVVQADERFENQLITEIGRRLGNTGFELGQAVKKTYEASGMINRGEREAAKRELLGAMNYLAAAYIMTEG